MALKDDGPDEPESPVEAEALPARWRALVDGQLSAAEEAALHDEAERSAETRRYYEVFRPLSAESEQRIVDRILGRLAAAPAADSRPIPEGAATSAPEAGRGSAPSPGNTEKNTGGLLAAPRRPRLLRSLGWTAPLAAAACLLIYVLAAPRWQPSPLPPYRIALQGGDRDLRAAGGPAEDAIPRLSPDSVLEVALRPAARVAEEVAVRAFLRREGRMRPWDVRPEHRAGSFVLRGKVSDLFKAEPGEWDLVFAIGRPGALPSDPEEVERVLRGEPSAKGQRWQALQRRVMVLPDQRVAP